MYNKKLWVLSVLLLSVLAIFSFAQAGDAGTPPNFANGFTISSGSNIGFSGSGNINWPGGSLSSSTYTGYSYTASSATNATNATNAVNATNIAGGSAGAIPFQSNSSTTTFNAGNFFWNNTSKRLGIGTSAPGYTLDVSGTGNLKTLSIDGATVTATAAELNFVDGVTSAIQTQLNAKAPLSNPTFTGTTTSAYFSGNGAGLTNITAANADTVDYTHLAGFTIGGICKYSNNSPSTISCNTVNSGTTNYLTKWVNEDGQDMSQSVIYDNGTNVGVGTTAPGYKLEVNNGATAAYPLNLVSSSKYIRIGALNSAYAHFDTDATSGFYFYDPAYIATGNHFFGTNAQNSYLVANGGNVGIGTTTPLSNLQIGSIVLTETDSPVSLSLGGTYSSTAGSNPKLKLFDMGIETSYYGLGVSANLMDFMVPTSAGYSWNINSVSKMTLDTNGNLGIGTVSPLTSLHVNSNTIGTVGGLFIGDNTNTSSMISFNSRVYVGYYNGYAVLQGTNTKGLQLNVNNNTYGSGTALTINTSGNVGIGTTTPGNKLQVNIATAGDGFRVAGNTSNNSSPQFSLYNNADQYGAVGLALKSTHYWSSAQIGDMIFRALNSSGRLVLTNQNNQAILFAIGPDFSNDTEKMRINPDGNVGIGTTSPANKLTVAGDVGAVSFIYTSDRNLKKNVKTLNDSLEKIMKLRGVSFNWKDNNNPGIGLIAQEVEKVFPELVNGGDGLKGVQYGNLVAPLIEAVKAQQQEIEAQKLIIKEQQADIKAINSRLRLLENKK